MTGKKGYSPRIHKYYKVEGKKVTRINKICSRCGHGIFMSEHHDRRTCGKCGLTEFL